MTANDIGSFNKGFNRGKFSQLRYLLGNTARVQTGDNKFVQRNQQEFNDMPNYK